MSMASNCSVFDLSDSKSLRELLSSGPMEEVVAVGGSTVEVGSSSINGQVCSEPGLDAG